MEFNKEQIKAIFITGIIILMIILAFLVFSIAFIIRSNNTNENVDVANGYGSIKEIVEHFGCKYKNETFRDNREFPTEINLVFKHQLYENDESQEEFFNSVIKEIAKYLRYSNFKMIDTENDITIQVTCQNGRILQIVINDIEDYFIYMDSQLELTQYKAIDAISLHSDIEAINYLIDNNWPTDVDFGERDSIFKNYYVYFDEGIKYRKIGSEVYNVVFTEKFTEPVVNNIKVGTTLASVEETLGKAPFKDEELGVLGYKGKDMYVFFTKNEISIYKNKTYKYKEFWNLVNEFLEDEDMEFTDFMNELTYTWKDYSEYTYDQESMFMAFPNRGVEIKLNYDGISGIILYNNMSEDLKVIKDYLKNTEFVSRLKLDSVFEAEKRRLKENIDFEEVCKKAEEDQDSTSMLFNMYLEKDNRNITIKAYFLSKTWEFVDRELVEQVDTYVWVSDTLFVYSVYQEGIYAFDVVTGEKQVIVDEGINKTFEIQSYENNVLKYNGIEIVLEF